MVNLRIEINSKNTLFPNRKPKQREIRILKSWIEMQEMMKNEKGQIG